MLIPVSSLALFLLTFPSSSTFTNANIIRQPTLLQKILTPEQLSLSISIQDPSPPTRHYDSFDCHPQGWVRAPDLYPGLSTEAHARLELNGTREECEKVETWGVGLRFKERGILRFRSPNITFPTRPTREDASKSFESRHSKEKDQPEIPNIFDTNVWYGPRRGESEYDKAMKEYDNALKDRSLWIVKAVERNVFDTKIDLPLKGAKTFEDGIYGKHNFKAVRSFFVDVPNTNFPPLQNGVHGVHRMNFEEDAEDKSLTETMLEYYFTLTLKNGSTLDFPVGDSAFLPYMKVERGASILNEKSLAEVQTLALEYVEDKNPWRHGISRSSVSQRKGQCETGADPHFEVTLQLPKENRYVAGLFQTVNVTVRQTGNTTQYPVQICIRPITCTTHTWAEQYASLKSHKLAINDCHPSRSDGCHNLNRMRMTSESDEQPRSNGEETAGLGAVTMGMVGDRRFDTFGFGGECGPKMIHDSGGGGSGQVNFSIPIDTFPDYNTTFFATRHLLRVELVTEAQCEHDEIEALNETLQDWEIDVLEDSNWSPYGPPIEQRQHVYQRFSHLTNMTIEIFSNRTLPNQSIFPVSYRSSEARSIVLSARQGDRPSQSRPESFPAIDHILQPELDEHNWIKNKYNGWKRGLKCPGDQRGGCGNGGANYLVSRSWWRKVWNDRRKVEKDQVSLE